LGGKRNKGFFCYLKRKVKMEQGAEKRQLMAVLLAANRRAHQHKRVNWIDRNKDAREVCKLLSDDPSLWTR
jgi:hypothetical protein